MKRKLFAAALVVMACACAAAAQTPQEKEAARVATREKLRQLPDMNVGQTNFLYVFILQQVVGTRRTLQTCAKNEHPHERRSPGKPVSRMLKNLSGPHPRRHLPCVGGVPRVHDLRTVSGA